MTASRSRVLLLGLLVAALADCGHGQSAAGETEARGAGFDEHTVGVGTFEGGPAVLGAGGPLDVKTSLAVGEGGLGGGSCLVVPSNGAVGLYDARGLDPGAGTIEMWVRPGPAGVGRQYLFSVEGARSLDGDGRLDLVVGTIAEGAVPTPSAILFGGDTGRSATFPSSVPRGMAVGDVDGDGELDLVVAMHEGATLPKPRTPAPGEVHVFAGPFRPGADTGPPGVVLEADDAQGLLLGDFDAHPGLDLIVASFGQGTPPFFGFSNDGKGGFRPMDLDLQGGIQAEGLAAGDVDRDGVLDVAFASLGAAPSMVFHGELDERGDYRIVAEPSGVSLASPHALGCSLADVDGDGWLDLVLALPFGGPKNEGQVAIHFNDGRGRLRPQPGFVLDTRRPFTVEATRDLDHDGAPDIVVANWGDAGVFSEFSTIHWGPFASGGAGRRPPARLPVDNAVSMTLGDLDGDGLADLVLRSATGSSSPVFRLDLDGRPQAGVDEHGLWRPSDEIPTLPTFPGKAGDGAGILAAAAGTMAYGTPLLRFNTLELFLEDGALVFAVHDEVGSVHRAALPFPPADGAGREDGFHHLQAGWSAAEGRVELRVGEAAATTDAQPFRVGAIGRFFRLGTDTNNARCAAGARIDEVRLSTIPRSRLDEG